MPMLTWKDGPRDLGCTYHKVAWFHSSAADGHIDVFVMPRIREQRPIAVTVKVAPKGEAERKAEEALKSVSDTAHLYGALVPTLTEAGVARAMATAFVDDVIALVKGDAVTLTAAMATAPK